MKSPANWTLRNTENAQPCALIVRYYYLQDLPSLRRTISENKGLNIPAEITRWLGRKSFEEGDYAATEQYLLPVVKDAKDVTQRC